MLSWELILLSSFMKVKEVIISYYILMEQGKATEQVSMLTSTPSVQNIRDFGTEGVLCNISCFPLAVSLCTDWDIYALRPFCLFSRTPVSSVPWFIIFLCFPYSYRFTSTLSCIAADKVISLIYWHLWPLTLVRSKSFLCILCNELLWAQYI